MLTKHFLTREHVKYILKSKPWITYVYGKHLNLNSLEMEVETNEVNLVKVLDMATEKHKKA